MKNSLHQDFSLKGEQKLSLSLAMRQSFHVLQLPVIELKAWLEEQIEENFVLEYDQTEKATVQELEDFAERETTEESDRFEEKKLRQYRESLITTSVSIHEHLMAQAREAFLDSKNLKIAEWIIGNLDASGFYTQEPQSAEEEAVLKIIQTFDPAGIAARDLQHSLLLQLQQKGKEQKLAYTLIHDHYDAMLHNQWGSLQKKLHCSEDLLKQIVREELASLQFHPTASFTTTIAPAIVPDISLEHDGEKWLVSINDEPLPQFHLASCYQEQTLSAELEKEEKAQLRSALASGKWIFHLLQKREKTLQRLAAFLIQKEEPFLLGESRSLEPLTMKEAATALGLHESTIARAVSGKYLFCPAGLFAMRDLFSQNTKSAKALLQQLIRKENKRSPYSDDLLALKLRSQGVPCARRTVTKYRKQLGIGSASERKEWFAASNYSAVT